MKHIKELKLNENLDEQDQNILQDMIDISGNKELSEELFFQIKGSLEMDTFADWLFAIKNHYEDNN